MKAVMIMCTYRPKTCVFTGHRPKSLPWGHNENDTKCLALKEQIINAINEGYNTFVLLFGKGRKASVFRRSYGTIGLTVILEELTNNKSKDMKNAINMLKDEIHNFLNDSELEEIFKPRETNKSHQDEKS